MGQKSPLFSFLTFEREKFLSLAINAANQATQMRQAPKKTVYDSMSNLGKSLDSRHWFLAHLKEYFSDDELVKFPEPCWNMGIMIFEDFEVALRFVKVENPYDLIEEPKTLQRAKIKFQYEKNRPKHKQLSLDGFHDNNETSEDEELNLFMLLGKLDHFIAGYVLNENRLIVELHLIKQERNETISHYQVNIASSTDDIRYATNSVVNEQPKADKQVGWKLNQRADNDKQEEA